MREHQRRPLRLSWGLLALPLLLLPGCTEVAGAGPSTDVGYWPFADQGAPADFGLPPEPDALVICEPGELMCEKDLVVQCSPGGLATELVAACPDGQTCYAASCVECFPGTSRCVGTTLERCGDDTKWHEEEDCAATSSDCVLGACVSACFQDFKYNSYSGCDYWAVDLDNLAAAQNSAYAVLVANLSEDPTGLTVTYRDGPTAPVTEAFSASVQGGGLAVLELPQRHLGGAGAGWKAWRLQSTAPIVAYQFNPLGNVDVFSNDASLLLPVQTFGKEYLVVSRAELVGAGPDGVGQVAYRGTATVVAAGEETKVTVTPTARTLGGNGVPALQPGQKYIVILHPYQVLNIKSDIPDGDLTGTEILADRPIGVFSGHEGAQSSDLCCADHLEQQLLPLSRWGRTYVATKSLPRGAEKDYWRVLASQDQTTVTFAPPVSGPVVLDRGEHYELSTTADFIVDADKPVLLTQLLASSGEVVNPPAFSPCIDATDCHPGYSCEVLSTLYTGCVPPVCDGPGAYCLPGHVCRCPEPDPSGGETPPCKCAPVGDPTLILAAPYEEYRPDYVFLTPAAYAQDYVNIIAPAGATVTLDAVAVQETAFQPIGDSELWVARLPIGDGVHRLTASAPVSVVVYGYDDDVSYGYLGGLNLHDLSGD